MKIVTATLPLNCITVLFLLLALPTVAQETKSKNLSIALNCGVTHSRIKSFPAPGVTEINLPDKTQKFSISYYYGLSLNYTLKLRYIISIGVNSTVNKIHYTIPEVVYQKPDSVWVNANGDIRNSTYSIGIPVQISYLLKSKPNTPFISLGALFNFYLGTQEKFKIYNDGDGTEIASGNDKYKIVAYKPMNIYVFLGGGYKYTLAKKLDLVANLMYNISTGRVLQKNLNVNANHRINFMQLGLCLNYNF